MDFRNYKTVGKRRFYDLKPGEMFRAVVHDIRPGEVTIRFATGEQHIARTKIQPDARIGEESGFLVKENDFEGRIILEMLKLDTETKKTNMLLEALNSAGLGASESMLEIGRAIVDNNVMANSENLQRASYFAQALGGDTDTVLLMLKEGFPADLSSVKAVETILSEPGLLLDRISEKGLPVFDPAEKNESLSAYLRKVFAAIYSSQAHKPNSQDEKVLGLLRFFGKFKSRRYVQIPFMASSNHEPLISELHHFQCLKAEPAVLTVNTAALGRIEALIEKGERGYKLNLLGDSSRAIESLKKNAARLEAVLTGRGFKLDGIKMSQL